MEINKKEFSTYSKEDVIFLLKDISNIDLERDNIQREKAIQGGKHYSEMLPVEYQVSDKYLDLYKEKLNLYKEKLAYCVGVMCEKILKLRGNNLTLVSLARAGTPVGILAKRYIKERYNLNLPHYTISIIRDRGIDENAIKYILKYHKGTQIQFIDGWTGKGTICKVLKEACDLMNKKYNLKLNESLAVLADPAGYSNSFGIREDFLIPSACLNSTISGLVSRTVLREDLIFQNDFHGAKYYKNLIEFDESNKYIDTITNQFKNVFQYVDKYMKTWERDYTEKLGKEDIENVKRDFNVKNINFIKPGIGETTRVLLRRIPYKILVRNSNDKEINHIFVLAKEKGTVIEEYPLLAYKCCGIIKNIKDL